MFSQAHHKLGLKKARTFFLAYQLYVDFTKVRDSIEKVPEEYVQMACLSMAMKFEEIYPSPLRFVVTWMRV